MCSAACTSALGSTTWYRCGSPCRQAALCTSRTGAGTAAVCEGADDAAVAWLMPPLGAAPMEAAPELPWTTT
jgi:hypothetical protein